MFPEENNVFDFVSEFYKQDPGWGEVMPQSVCETFLRKQSWAGRSDEELIEMWNHMLMFIFYCGHAETMPGDMTADDFIQCIGWCSRNIGEFEAKGDFIRKFLDTLVLFCAYLVESRVVMPTDSAEAAREKLFGNGKFTAMTRDGWFQGEFERFNKQGIPDLPSRIFIDLGEQMVRFNEFMNTKYIKKTYYDDYRKARHIYERVTGDVAECLGSPEQYEQSFAEFFFFDYKLLATGRPVIEEFAKRMEGDIGANYSHSFIQVLKELTKAKLMLLKVKKEIGDGVFSVVDILRNQSHVMLLPIDKNVEVEDTIFYGHTFNDDTMIVNSIGGTILTPAELKKLKEMLRRAKDYYAVRQGGKCSWDDFISHNQLLVRTLPMLIVMKVDLVEDLASHISGYKKAKLNKKDFLVPVLPKLFPKELFSVTDVEAAMQMWADVQATDIGEEKEEDPILLALAVSRIYINLCGVYNFRNPPKNTVDFRKAKKEIDRITKEITELLHIERFDPRYVNEEGLFIAHIMEAREKHHGW